MATKHAAGTPVEGAYDSFTAEQLAKLEDIKDRKYALGVAQAKYVNHVLLPNGTIEKSAASCEEAAKSVHKKALDDDLSDPKVLTRAAAAAAKVQEVRDHIAQKRFLFVVDSSGVPVVYFQCATKGNPDLPRVATKADEQTQSDARESIALAISNAHAAAKRRAAQE